MASLHLENIVKSFGSAKVIKGVDLDIKDGEFVVFVGPSGCGKSTLLRLIAGLEDITSGTLKIDEKVVNDLEPKERGIAMVFQSYAIFPHMTVRENMAFGLTVEKASKAAINEKVGRAAKILQMEHLLDRRPSQLSGGQRQRVAIGRSITRDPAVFLFDEPLSNLDAALRMSMRMEISALHKQLGTTMVYVTHDQVEAMTLADKIVVLKDGEVLQVGAPMELYHNPASKFVAGFLGSPAMNFLDVEIKSAEEGHITVSNDALDPVQIPTKLSDLKVGQTVCLGIRPQYLKPEQDTVNGRLHGRVSISERLGTETVLDVALKTGGSIIAALPEDMQFSQGTEVAFSFDPAMVHVFE